MERMFDLDLSKTRLNQAKKLEAPIVGELNALFSLYGVLTIKDVFDPGSLVKIRQYWEKNLGDGFPSAKKLKEAQQIDKKRYIFDLNFSGPFNNSQIYANPIIYDFLEMQLGSDFVLESAGIVCSLPGSKFQRLHTDHPILFSEAPLLSSTLPVYAISIGIPLVNLSLENGPTLLYSGSHRITKANILSVFRRIPIMKLGSCYIWDYRVWHAGMPNRSNAVRPLLYVTYCRPWFRDAVNLIGTKTRKLLMSDQEYRKVPVKYRRLFTYAESPGQPPLKYKRKKRKLLKPILNKR